jgi:hypothetical protein
MGYPDNSGIPTAAQLQRLAVEAPEQLMPVLRRAALGTARRRLVELLRECLLATFNALASRPKEARAAMARALELDPEMRVSNIEDRIGGFRRPAADKCTNALRKAGLPD